MGWSVFDFLLQWACWCRSSACFVSHSPPPPLPRRACSRCPEFCPSPLPLRYSRLPCAQSQSGYPAASVNTRAAYAEAILSKEITCPRLRGRSHRCALLILCRADIITAAHQMTPDTGLTPDHLNTSIFFLAHRQLLLDQ